MIEENGEENMRYEVSFDYFNSEYRFAIFRNFIVNEWIDMKGKPRAYDEKIWALNCWITIHKETFEEVTPEELFKNPAANRRREKNLDSVPIVTKKSNNSNPIKICIDLTIDDEKTNISRHCRRKVLRQSIKEKKNKYTLDEKKNEAILKQQKKKAKNEFSKNTFSNKIPHLSRDKLKKKYEKERYKNRREEGQCFLYALRAISNGFSFDLYSNLFIDLNFNNQIDLANDLLMEHSGEKLISGGKFIGTLNQVRENNSGRFICSFLYKNLLHCEGIVDNCYSKEITKEILASEDEERSFSLYFLRNVKK